MLDTTEIYAVHTPRFLGSVQVVLQGIIDELTTLVPHAMHQNQ